MAYRFAHGWLIACDRFWIQSSTDHAWKNDHEDRENLQIASQQRATTSIGDRLGSENALDHHLIGTPVPRRG